MILCDERRTPMDALCAQAVASAQLSVEGWSTNSTESRAGAVEAAKDASESAQMCHKFMRSIQAKA